MQSKHIQHITLFVLLIASILGNKLVAQSFTTVFPKNNVMSADSTINFQWNTVTGYNSYRLEISSSSSFSTFIHIGNTITINTDSFKFTTFGIYYWRVKAYTPSNDSITSNSNSIELFSPKSISGIQAWFNPYYGITEINGKITQWNDISGLNRIALQGDTSKSPSLITNEFNNHSILKFDGLNDILQIDFTQTFTQPNSFIFYWKSTATDGSPRFPLDGIESTKRNAIYQTGNTIHMYNGGSELTYTKPTPFDNIITTSIFNTTTSSIYENGNLKSIGNTGSFPISGLKIGADFSNTYFLQGDFTEMIYYNKVLTNSERAQTEKYLTSKYAPPVNLGYDININYGFCDTILYAGTHFSKYLWNTGDTTEQIKATKNGRYWVTTTDLFGLQSSDTIKVTYLSKPNPISDTIVCQFDTTKASINIGSPYTYNWSNGQSTANFSTSIPGIYQLQIADSLGCMYRDTFTVILDSLPSKLTLGNDTAICFSNPIGYDLIDYTPIDGLSGNFQYLWNTGDTTATTAINSTSDYSLRLTNQRGCVAHDTVNITMQGIPPAVNYTISKDSACTGDTIHFTDLTSGGIVSRNWDLGNGTSLSDSTFDYSYNNAGIYTISLTATGSNGCPKTVYKTLLIHASPQVLFTTVPACTGLPTIFTNTSIATIGDTILTQQWNFDDLVSGANNTSTLQNPEHLFSNAGTFTPQLSVTTRKGCSATSIQTLDVASTATSPSPFTLVAPQNDALISDSTITFKWNYSDNAYFYTLQIATDDTFSSIIFQKDFIQGKSYSYKFSTYGTYYWKIIASNICGNNQPSIVSKMVLFSPKNINGIQVWLNPDYGITANNSKISEWKDIGGLNRIAIQSDTLKSPNYIQNELNNHPIIHFDGINDYLNINFNETLSQPNTFIIFWKSTSTDLLPRFPFDGIESAKRNAIYSMNSSIHAYNGGSELNYTKTSPFNYIITTSIFNSSTSFLFENSILKSSGATGSYPINGLNIGTDFSTSYYLQGNIAEIIYYNNVLSDIERVQTEQYLMNKYAPPVSLGYDFKIPYRLCDTTISAQASHFTHYLWSTGDTTPFIHVNKSGSYWVQTTNIFEQISSDTIQITFSAQRTIPDNAICVGNSYQYNWSPLNNYTLNWSNGNSGSAFTETQPGQYTFTLTDTLGCIYRDTFNLYVDSLSLRMSLGNNLSLCSGNLLNYTLDNYTLTSPQYLWNTGDTTASILLTTSGDYWLKITNNQGCIAQDTVSVYIHGLVPLVSFTTLGKCLGESTPFNDLSTSQDQSIINQWQWNFGDGNNSTSQNPTHNYALPGIYPITLTVTTDSNCSNTTTIPTVVYTLPEVNFTPQVGCSNTLIQFTDQTQYTDNYTLNQWQWNFGDAQSGSYNQSILQHPNHSFDTSGTYTVKLRATSIVGCTDSTTKTITIRSAPAANFVASNTCEGKTTWFSDSTTTNNWNPIMSRTWIFEDESSSSEIATSRKYLDYGSYPVTYIVTSLNGCTDTITKNINVYAVPVANFTPNSFCSNEPVILESSSSVESDIITYERWKIGNNRILYGSPVQLYLDSAANYPVQLISTSQHNCSDTVVKNITVKPIPQSQFTYKYDELSVGYNIQFINNTTGASSFEWYSSNGLFSTDQNPIYDFSSEGTFPILLISMNDQSCTDSATANVMIVSPVMDISVSDFTITTSGNYQQAHVNLINMSNRNITDLWITLQINDQQIRERWTGMIRPGEIIPYQFNTQIYTRTNEVLEYGCIKIESPIFTQETNLDNNQICITLGEEFNVLKLYPNPAKEYITLWLSSPYESEATIRILSTKGSEIKTWSNQILQEGINQLKLPLIELSNGLYIMEIEFNNKTERMKFNVIR